WAWTNLSGGVPDADDTSGALLAVAHLSGTKHLKAAEAGIRWLLDLQNSDGGIPTFCQGWGALPFDRSAPDLTAHALEAWSAWHAALDANLQRRVSTAAERALRYLASTQRQDGSWLPLWFGNQHVPDETNPTYGTARVLAGLSSSLVCESPTAKRSFAIGMQWMLKAQNADGGWGGARSAPSSIEETGIALQVVRGDAATRGAQWLIAATDEGRRTPASPIGLYFARLWYDEELYPMIFALKGLSRVRACSFRLPVPSGQGNNSQSFSQ
ncbi:MAG: squalene--hopene cyclase, partial [Acidobacteria bacterium]|nr:squalene--hopene cyclase [Acidobacteriota bacterium]